MDKRGLKKLSVLVSCHEGDKKNYGSGNLIEVAGSYYVLTAAHCVQYKDKRTFYGIDSITISKDIPEDLEDVRVTEILHKAELGDIAALRIELGAKEQEKHKKALSRLHLLEDDYGHDVIISGYQKQGELWDVYDLKLSGEKANSGLVKYQYQGPDMNNQDDPIAAWKGLSGSGLFFENDGEYYMTAILISTDSDVIQNNEFWFVPASQFVHLISNLQITPSKIVEDREQLQEIEKKGHFSVLQDSLLSDEVFRGNAFIKSKKLQDIISELRDDDNDNILIAALSGLGKTRLLYEAFKAGYPLANCFFARYYGDSAALLSEAEKLLIAKHDDMGLLIIDDCDLDVYENLLTLCLHTNRQFRLIATNHDFFEAKRRNIEGTCLLEADDIRDDINNFIDEQLTITDQNKTVRDEIKNIADGYPQMAIDLVKAYKEGINPEMNIVEGLMRRILDFNDNDKESRIMQTLSLCQPMPYDSGQREAFLYMLRSDYFTPLFAQITMKEREYVAEQLVKKLSPTLIQTQSSWLMVRPFPLAVYLTRQWFENCPNEHFMKLLAEIQQQPTHIQKSVSLGFCKHIEQMHGNKSAFELVEKLVNRPEGSPFLNEEVLCSGLGSEFFLAFSHVNPSAIAHNIWMLLESKTIEWVRINLKEDARRNIVFALERLSFAKESFRDAFKALCKLSIAENEDRISNNATGQIVQLFHIQLAGTEVDLAERRLMLRWLKKKGEEYMPLTLKCINSAFANHGFTRMGGSERFGMEHREDYIPKTYGEIFDYWDSVRDMLIEIAQSHPDTITEVSGIVENHAYTWFRDRNFKLVYSLMDALLPMHTTKWSSLYNQLSRHRGFILSSMMEEEKERFFKYMEKLRPNHFIVSLNDARHNYWDVSYKLSDEESNIRAKSIFEPLVDQFIEDSIFKNEDELTYLLDDKDYIDYIFIATLCERMSAEQADAMFATIYEILRKKDETYLSGFMMTLCRVFRNTSGCNSFISKVEQLGRKTLYIKLIAGNDLENLEGYQRLREQYRDKQEFLETYLMSYQSLDGTLYCQLLNTVLMDYPDSANELMHFVLHRRFFSSESVQKETEPIIKKLILNYEVNPERGNDTYEYASYVADFIEHVHDKDFAVQVCHKYIDLYNSEKLHTNFERVFPALLKYYSDDVWEMIANSLVSEDYLLFYFQVRSELGSGTGFGAGPLFQVPNSEKRFQILCKKYPETAPVCMAEMIPCFSYVEDKDGTRVDGFSSYFVWLLENYGDNHHVLSGLHANLGTFSWTGSTIPYYNRNIECFKKLLETPSLSSDVKEWAASCIKQYEKEKNAEMERETYMKFHYGYEP